MDIYRNFETLWGTTNKNYMKKNAREHSMSKLVQEVAAAGLHVDDDEESIKKEKLKNLKDCYRNELNKIKRSKKVGQVQMTFTHQNCCGFGRQICL